MPARLRTTLRFDKVALMNNVGSNYANIRFEPTYAYDVDPTVGSTAMPGFTELAGVYRKYRVIGFKASLKVSNAESFPLTLYAGPTNSDPGANTINYNNYLPNKAIKKVVLSAKGGRDAASINDRVTVANFGGASNLSIEDGYSALTSTATPPNNNVFYMIGMYSSSNFVSGVWYTIDLDIELDFYELANPSG